MLGDLQNPQEGLLTGREGLRQVTLLAHAEDDYTLELPGYHVGARAAGGLIVPARERRVAHFQAQRMACSMRRQISNEINSTRPSASMRLRSLQEQRIDDLIVLEKAEVSLDRVLVFVGP
jgi:hypothetical protein